MVAGKERACKGQQTGHDVESPQTEKGTADSRLKEQIRDLFHRYLLRGHRVIEAENQNILGCLALHPRKVVFYDESSDGYFTYHSRGHRKHRLMEFKPKDEKNVQFVPHAPRLFSLQWSNISWHVAVLFSLGSICWIVNGQYALMQSSASNVVNGIGYSALIGGLLFWVGAYFAVLEALNVSKNLNFGVAVHELVHDLEKRESKFHSYKHYHMERLKKMHNNPDYLRFQHMKSFKVTLGDDETDMRNTKGTTLFPASWKWWGYVPSIGFVAAFLQFIGATFFAIAVICGVPGVIGATEWQLQQAFIWTMQCVGSVFFVISSWIMMVEEQANWYMPALDRIGWHASFWNLIGSIGFLLSAIFGYLANWEGNGTVCCQLWGTAFNTYYGSWAFMIASALLYYEVLNPEPATISSTLSLLQSRMQLAFANCFGNELIILESTSANKKGQD
eukprot:jgi/Picsp_1/447/NSC_00445-R1_integral membrane protein